MRLLFSLFILMSFAPGLVFAKAAPYKNICEVQSQYYCKYVGNEAYLKGDKHKAILGKIIAVTWKDKGDPIEINPNLTAIEDGLYYVIDTDGKAEHQIVVLVNLIKVVK